MISLLFLFLIQPSEATTARVLIDESARQIKVQGRIKVQCLSHKSGHEVQVKDCSQVHLKNRLRQFSFRKRNFTIKIFKQGILLRDSSSRKRWFIYGQKFRLQGDFVWRSKTIQTLDVFSGNQAVHWVVELPIDNYLKGVLSGEVPSSWPLEALKAQAIASRTYFLWKKKERRAHYDVRSDHMDQVFKMQEKIPQSIRQAIEETKDVVLAKSQEDYFPAYYHSDCGGHTNPEDKVWRKPHAANQNVEDSVCKGARRNQWTYQIGKSELIQILREKFSWKKESSLLAILPKRQKGRRAFTVDLVFSNGQVKRLNANEFRKALGFAKLKSTNFIVYSLKKHFKFEGRGYGHGVGMCQWGAQRWAKKGKSFQQILQHYYPLARLAKFKKRSSSQSVALSQTLE